MSRSWAMVLVTTAVAVTACSGGDSAEPTSTQASASTTSSAPTSVSTPADTGTLMWDLSTAPAGWDFVRPEYAALAVYSTAGCTGTFDTIQPSTSATVEAEDPDATPAPVDSDSTLDAALTAYAEKAGLTGGLDTAPADERTVPVVGTDDTLTLVGRTLTGADTTGFAYGYAADDLALSVVVLCDNTVDDAATAAAPFLDALAVVRE